MKKNKTIDLFGNQVILHERTVEKYLELVELSKNVENDSSTVLFIASVILNNALEDNLRTVKQPTFLQKLFRTSTYKKFIEDSKWNELFTVKNIMKQLTSKELFNLCAEVVSLEGRDNTYYRLLANDLSEAEINKFVEGNKKKVNQENL